jgi:hypothetical protein
LMPTGPAASTARAASRWACCIPAGITRTSSRPMVCSTTIPGRSASQAATPRRLRRRRQPGGFGYLSLWSHRAFQGPVATSTRVGSKAGTMTLKSSW